MYVIIYILALVRIIYLYNTPSRSNNFNVQSLILINCELYQTYVHIKKYECLYIREERETELILNKFEITNNMPKNILVRNLGVSLKRV